MMKAKDTADNTFLRSISQWADCYNVKIIVPGSKISLIKDCKTGLEFNVTTDYGDATDKEAMARELVRIAYEWAVALKTENN